MPERTSVKTILVNGTELHYVERGKGVPVVFVHGGLGDFRTWLPQVERFGAHYRVVSYSRRAHYPNAWPDGYEAAMAVHVADLAALIRELDLGRTHLVGNSYGSYIALVLALRHPEMVRSLVLAEPPLHPLLKSLPGGEAMLAGFMEAAWEPAGRAFLEGDMEGGVRLFMEGAVGEGAWEKLPPRARNGVMKDAPELAVATQTSFERHMLPITCDELRWIEAPTLLLRGENSPLMYRLINDEVARCIPQATQALIPDAAHVLHTQNPERHDSIVLDWLAQR